jgi:hypothetical protein
MMVLANGALGERALRAGLRPTLSAAPSNAPGCRWRNWRASTLAARKADGIAAHYPYAVVCAIDDDHAARDPTAARDDRRLHRGRIQDLRHQQITTRPAANDLFPNELDGKTRFPCFVLDTESACRPVHKMPLLHDHAHSHFSISRVHIEPSVGAMGGSRTWRSGRCGSLRAKAVVAVHRAHTLFEWSCSVAA